tara:strand:+ start:1772 stop:2200 length:429 start_codon:yes stop_codon:yes gene_type:complete
MTAVQARLLGQVAAYKSSGIADDFAELIREGSMPHQVPAFYVVSRGDRGAKNTHGTGAHVQKITTRIAVVTVTYRKGSRAAAKAMQDLWELLPLELGALAGWSPGGSYEPLSLTSREQLSSPGQSAVFHMSEYATSWHLRRT